MIDKYIHNFRSKTKTLTFSSLQNKYKHIFAVAVLLLTFYSNQAIAATINVDSGAVDNTANGNCSIIEAVDSANMDTGIDNCTPGSGADEIILPAESTFTLTEVNNADVTSNSGSSSGNNGLPRVTTEIVIEGNGSIIERDSGATENFRILLVDGSGDSGNLTLRNLTISGGVTSGTVGSQNNGGAILNLRGVLTIENSTISDNTTSTSGGGIYNRVGTTIITNSTISDNTAGRRGGGIYTVGNNITIINSTISGNTAPIEGGGIYYDNGTLSITNSTISDNTTGRDGGGIYSRVGPSIVITNSTISGNTAAFRGGGIHSRVTLSITNSTISGNTAALGGGIYSIVGIITTINSSIVSDNSATDLGPNCLNGITTVIDGGNNLSDDGNIMTPALSECFDGSMGSSSITNFDTANCLGLLADNGGSTQTKALILDGSCTTNPAIDGTGAACVGTPVNGEDQRNFPRDSMCDIGAFEFQPVGIVSIIKTTDPTGETGFDFTSTGFPDGCSLQASFTLSDGETLECIVPLDDFSVVETVPIGFVLSSIDCTETGSAISTDNTNNPSVDISIKADGDTVDCIFTNDDLDACMANPCDANATCTDLPPPALDTPTGRICACNPGFIGDGEPGNCRRRAATPPRPPSSFPQATDPKVEIIPGTGGSSIRLKYRNIDEGAKVLIDLPDNVFGKTASLIPEEGICEILTPALIGRVKNPDIECNVNKLTERTGVLDKDVRKKI